MAEATQEATARWRLVRGEECIGEIEVDGSDFPWMSGRFRPAPGFDEVRPLFERELALLDDPVAGADSDEWEAVVEEIGSLLRLVGPAGPVAEFLLHVDGDRAWFRWSDEPFDE
ncbi:hypothetical protein [Kitasatospora sp. LaBMicrA B282]|uniref:hypothetical protein n=1 Tax=Kitasatospora sp. LaBMicrA B282 TaxID=3420949 RepID=UPI003D11C617